MTETVIDTGTDELLCAVRDKVAVITLNRPQARNSLSDQLSPALRRMIKHCGADDAIGAVMITGAGTAFCSGGDVKGMGANSSKNNMSFDDRVADLRVREKAMTGALVGLRKPTIAALPGAAAGAGLAIALACDIRVAAESASLIAGYARVALSGDYGIAWLLTRLVGTSRARELLFFNEKIDAQRGLALGLVNKVVPDAELQTTAFEMARTLAYGPRVAFAYMKDNLDQAVSGSFIEALDQEADRLVRAAATADHKEAVRAFVEKRAPVFTGS
ncbi:MAG: enoyl-CoA hydratase [Proteobacteria bacterium SG_bin9]|nr:MAG: enoyl-CoA hydratase [Proteobacteria bacterium SG_bin9]